MPKTKNRLIEIHDPIYKRQVNFYVGDYQWFERKYRKLTKNNVPEDLAGNIGFCIYTDGRNGVIYLQDFKLDAEHIEVLVHEVLHDAIHALLDVGVEIEKSGESYCYYFGFLVREFLKAWQDETSNKKP